MKNKDLGSFRKSEDLDLRYGLVYARVSSRKQKNEGHGLESQEQRCMEEMGKMKIPYERSFLDNYTGGGDFMRRPAMRELLEYIDNNPHKKFTIVFDDLKRFARDTEFHLKLRAALKARDVAPICLNYDFDDSPEGEYVETIQAAHNQLERKQNQRQVIQKQQARLRGGYNAFHAPLGYKKVRDPIHGTIDIPTEKSKYIKEALEGYASRRFINKIDAVRFLQEKNVLSNKQNAIKGISTFTNLLNNIFYAGFIEYKPWEVEKRLGHHKAIIDESVYNTNQKRLKQKSSEFTRQDIREDFSLRGFVNCSCCGKKLTGAPSRSKTGKLHPYYKCANKSCELYGKSIKAEDIHNGFEDLLKQVKASENLIDLSVAIFEDCWESEINNKESLKSSYAEDIEKLKEKIEQLITLASNTEIETVRKQYEKQIEKYGIEIEELEAKINKSFDYTIPYRTSSKEVLGVLRNPYSVWKSYNVYQKQKFFSFIFEENLRYDKIEGYRTPNYSLPITIFELVNTSKSEDLETMGIEPMSKSII